MTMDFDMVNHLAKLSQHIETSFSIFNSRIPSGIPLSSNLANKINHRRRYSSSRYKTLQRHSTWSGGSDDSNVSFVTVVSATVSQARWSAYGQEKPLLRRHCHCLPVFAPRQGRLGSTPSYGKQVVERAGYHVRMEHRNARNKEDCFIRFLHPPGPVSKGSPFLL